MIKILEHFDTPSFVKIKIWDFWWRSLFKEYGRTFLFKVVLAHPLKTFKGLNRYKAFLKEQASGRSGMPQSLIEEKAFRERIKKNNSNLLVGLGFCLKPFDAGDPAHSCPSGRSNHDCIYLEKRQARPVCLGCTIFNMSRQSLERGFRVYIMTSAEDMAHDFLIPQISAETFPLSLLFLCSYSIQAIIPALLICGADSFLVSYTKGDCRDYEQWRRADLGHKKEVTELDESSWEKVLDIYKNIEPVTPASKGFKREGNIFIPE